MAKCIQLIKSKEVKRVSNEEAKQLFKSGKIKYISKSDMNRIKFNQSEEN